LPLKSEKANITASLLPKMSDNVQWYLINAETLCCDLKYRERYKLTSSGGTFSMKAEIITSNFSQTLEAMFYVQVRKRLFIES